MERWILALSLFWVTTLYAERAYIPFPNFQKSETCYPQKVFQPETIKEVVEIIREARRSEVRVMTANTEFRSLNRAGCTDRGHYQITLWKMAKVTSIDKEKKTVTVQAGAKFDDVMNALANNGFTISMVNGFADVTIGGMLGGGTHGSTLAPNHFAFIGDYLKQVTVVDGRGSIKKVSGKDLKAFGVNLGVLGVVVDATFTIQPLYKVRAEQASRDDTNFENEIMELAYSNSSISINWFPGIGRYSYVSYHPIPISTKGEARNTQLEIPQIGVSLFDWLFQLSHNKKTRAVACATSYLRDFSTKIPFFKEGKVYKKNAVGYAHKMHYFSCSKGQCLFEKSPMNLQALAIDIKRLPDWIKDVKAILKASPACFPANGIYLRFAPASQNYLSLAYGRDTAIIDVEFIMNKREGRSVRDYHVNQEIEQLTLTKYQARAHWGKNRQVAFANIDHAFPMWHRFVATKKKFDPKGLFVNNFWLNTTKNITSFPGCALNSRCFCTDDSDCYEGLSCQPGRWYSEANVCR